MATEIELKFRVGADNLTALESRLNSSASFGQYTLRAADRQRHDDSYFDLDGRLRSLNASLRIREAKGLVFITYKGPARAGRISGTYERREIENEELNDLQERFDEILAVLQSVNVLETGAAAMSVDVIRTGLEPALHRLGFSQMFRVTTDRQSWLVMRGHQTIAQLALDRSEFSTAGGATDRMNQLEIELADPANRTALGTLRRIATNELGLQADDTTKADRGWALYVANDRRDKVEVKVQLRRLADYQDLRKRLDADHAYFEGYRVVSEGVSRDLHDVYYDNDRFALAKGHAYLRVRTDRHQQPPVRELTFRQQQGAAQDAHLQSELKVDLGQPEAAAVWRTIVELLQREGFISGGQVATAGTIERQMGDAGLHVSLEADIDRTAWVVEEARPGPGGSPSTAMGGERQSAAVAKIKLDFVNFRNPAVPSSPEQHHAEVELTGVEDYHMSPDHPEMASYGAFVAAFCRRLQTDRPFGGTKYLSGLHRVGPPRLRSQFPEERSELPNVRLRRPATIERQRAQLAFVWLAVLFAGFTASAILGARLEDLAAILSARLGIGPGVGPLAIGVIALPYLAGALLFAIRDNAVTSAHVRWTLAGLLGIVLVVVTALGPAVGAAVVAIIGLAFAVLPLFGIDFVRRL